MVDSGLKNRLVWAREIAVVAGHETLRYFQSDNLMVQTKEDGSPLTLADQRAETLLRTRIADKFPSDAVLGEEFGETPGSNEYRWILDPIDGTKSFVCGVPLYGTMIGIECSGLSAAGVIYFPALDEGVFAATGAGAIHFKKNVEAPSRVSSVAKLSESVVLTTSVEAFSQKNSLSGYLNISQRAKFARTWGDVYGYFLVATGRAEVMIDPLMNIWDAAALLPIIHESGGCFTDWKGHSRIDGGDSVATNGKLHAEVLSSLTGS